MNIGTTSIDSLPLSPQTDNVRMDTYEQNVKIPSLNPPLADLPSNG